LQLDDGISAPLAVIGGWPGGGTSTKTALFDSFGRSSSSLPKFNARSRKHASE
jgi:hypothetical protein